MTRSSLPRTPTRPGCVLLMLFASTSLAARIERAERRLLTDSAAAVARRGGNVDVAVIPIGGGVAVFTGVGSPLNKVAAIGFEGPIGERDLELVEHAFARRGVPVRVEIACLADPSIGRLLTRRGYTLEGFENVLGRSLPDHGPPSAAGGVSISRGGADDLAAWLDVVVTGFASPDSEGLPSDESFPRDVLERVILDVASAEGFIHYLARRGGELAGGGSMRICEGVAQLCGAATLPEHRRRGVQSTLVRARLEDAARAGCDIAVVTTQPGSKSQQNAQRQGFALLYTRAVLVREA